MYLFIYPHYTISHEPNPGWEPSVPRGVTFHCNLLCGITEPSSRKVCLFCCSAFTSLPVRIFRKFLSFFRSHLLVSLVPLSSYSTSFTLPVPRLECPGQSGNIPWTHNKVHVTFWSSPISFSHYTRLNTNFLYSIDDTTFARHLPSSSSYFWLILDNVLRGTVWYYELDVQSVVTSPPTFDPYKIIFLTQSKYCLVYSHPPLSPYYLLFLTPNKDPGPKSFEHLSPRQILPLFLNRNSFFSSEDKPDGIQTLWIIYRYISTLLPLRTYILGPLHTFLTLSSSSRIQWLTHQDHSATSTSS